MKKVVISDEFRKKAQAARAARAQARGANVVSNPKFRTRNTDGFDVQKHGSMADDIPNAAIVKHNPDYVRKIKPKNDNPHGVDDLPDARIVWNQNYKRNGSSY